MPEFMSDEKRALELRPNVFMEDKAVCDNDGRATTVKHH